MLVTEHKVKESKLSKSESTSTVFRVRSRRKLSSKRPLSDSFISFYNPVKPEAEEKVPTLKNDSFVPEKNLSAKEISSTERSLLGEELLAQEKSELTVELHLNDVLSCAVARKATLSSLGSRSSSSLSTSSKSDHPRVRKRKNCSLPRSSSSTSETRRKSNYHSLERHQTNYQPRVLNRRVKKDRRSKSADLQSKKHKINLTTRAKDDLDKGEFTVVARPERNPWGDLKRIKSEPYLHCPRKEETVKQNPTDFENTPTKTKSTPNLNQASLIDSDPKPFERHRSTLDIYVQPFQTVSLITSTTESKTKYWQQYNSTFSQTTQHFTDQEPVKSETVSFQIENHDSKVQKTQSETLKNQKEVLHKALEFQKSCEDILEDLVKEANTPLSLKESLFITRDNNQFTPEEIISGETLTENTEDLLASSSERSFSNAEETEEELTRRVVIVKGLSSDFCEDLHKQGIDIVKDFIHQLISDDKRQTALSIKTDVEFEANRSSEDNDDAMYRKNLQKQGLGIARTSSMPEMTRDEFLEKQDELRQGQLKRNNSLTNIHKEKKKVIKTRVSSRLLQPTAASSRKIKSKIPYVPPSKKQEPLWTDRPLKNVDSGYTSQTFVKYYESESPKSNEIRENLIFDKHEAYEWRGGNQSYHRSQQDKQISDQTQYSVDSPSVKDENQHEVDDPDQKYRSQIKLFTSFRSGEYKYPKPEIQKPSSTSSLSGTEDDEKDPRKMRTGFIIDEHTDRNQYRSFTTNSQQNTTFLTAKQIQPSIHDSKTFKYVYTIDAELSYREYNKLMNIINLLQEQKKKWEDEVVEVRDKLEKTGKEKMQLSHNNHILRQSLEAANRAIKEINGKVHELKQTLVPLREDNTTLKDENDELKSQMVLIQRENVNLTYELKEYQKLEMDYEEKLSSKDIEIQNSKKGMHEKFRKLEEAYRIYKDDIKTKQTVLYQENEELRKTNEQLKYALEMLKNENKDFQEIIQELERKNEKFDYELKKQKLIDEQLQNATKETQLLTSNAKELEKMHKEELKKATEEIDKVRKEIDEYKDDSRALEGENDKLKYDVKQLEKRLKDIESQNETKENERQFEKQEKEILSNEINEFKKQLVELEVLKQERMTHAEEKQRHKQQVEDLHHQLMEHERLKRENSMNQKENQRLKSEVEKLKNELNERDGHQKELDTHVAENQKLKDELQNLKQQLVLLEDKQKYISSPFNDEIKHELENIRTQMKDLAEKKQERKVEVYTDELRGDLESLRNQIKDLDQLGRKSEATLQHSLIIKESNNTTTLSEKEKILEKVIYIKDEKGNLKEAKKADLDNIEAKVKTQVLDEESVQKVEERQVNAEAPTLMETNETKTFYEKSYQEEKPKQNENSFVEKTDENMDQLKEKQIEDRIRRKREQQTGWQLRTPDIHKMKRSSMDNLDDEEVFKDDGEMKPRGRSRSSGRRARSLDPKKRSESLERLGRSDSSKRQERGRSPHRRLRGYQSPTENKISIENHQHEANLPKKHYKIELTVDNSRVDAKRQQEINQIMHNTNKEHSVAAAEIKDVSPSRRRKILRSKERKLSKEKTREHERYDDSSSDFEERKPRKKSQSRLRNQGYDASAEMLMEAMRSRQEQAMTNKILKPLHKTQESHTEKIDVHQTITSALKPEMKVDYQQPPLQKYDQQYQRKERYATQRPAEEHPQILQQTPKQYHNLYQQARPATHEHRYHSHQQEQYATNTQVKAISVQNIARQNKVDIESRYHTLPMNRENRPAKPKRHFDNMDRGYQTDSSPMKDRLLPIHSTQSQKNIYIDRTHQEQTTGNNSKPLHSHHVRPSQSVTLKLQPSINAVQNEQGNEYLYATVNKTTTKSSRKALSEDELIQVERMEKARQKHLSKHTDEKLGTTTTNKIISALASKDVITKAGVPLSRTQQHEVMVSKNNFITEQQAEAMFSQDVIKSSTRGRSHEKEDFSKNNLTSSSSNEIIPSSLMSYQQDARRQQQQQMERSHTLPHNFHKKTTAMYDEQHHRSSEKLTRANIEKYQSQSYQDEKHRSHNLRDENHQNQANQAYQGEKLQSRSYRDTRLHDDVHRRQKSSQNRDSAKRLSAMSYDSLGGSSQITYTTVNEAHRGSRYDDYATQIDGDVEKSRRRVPNNAAFYDDTNILKHAKHIPKGHSKFHCEKCRELNKTIRNGESIKFCWEKYYPISETTPRSSIVNLQNIK